MTTRCLVTGANGFVGLPLSLALRHHGHEVIGLVRRPCPALEDAGIEQRQISDLADDDDPSLANALGGVQTVYHLAARTHSPGASASDYDHDNISVTRRLTELACVAGVGHLVFVSSVKAMGERSDGEPLTPDTVPRPEDDYGRSKLAAEQFIARRCASAATGYTIIRPPLIYGAGALGNLERLIRLIHRGLPLPLGAVENRRSMISRQNLIDLMLAIISRPTGRILLPHDSDWSTPDLIRHLAAAMNRPARLWPVPPSLLRLAAKAVGRQAITDRLTGSLQVDDPWLRDTLGWRAPLPATTGLAEMALAAVADQSARPAR